MPHLRSCPRLTTSFVFFVFIQLAQQPCEVGGIKSCSIYVVLAVWVL